MAGRTKAAERGFEAGNTGKLKHRRIEEVFSTRNCLTISYHRFTLISVSVRQEPASKDVKGPVIEVHTWWSQERAKAIINTQEEFLL